MPDNLQQHWIDGEHRPSPFDFALDSRAEPGGLRFARSSPRDLDDALQAGGRAASTWAKRPRRERVERARELLARIETSERAQDWLAERFELAPSEARALHGAQLFRARESIEIAADGVETRPGAGVFGAHWTDLVAPLAARVALRLVDGSTVTVIADARFPGGALELARAAESTALDRGALNVLFDDSLETLELALGASRVNWARVAGHDALVARLARRAHAGLELAQRVVENRSRVLREDLDPASAALETFETSLGRSATLSGQLPDRIGRVLCPGKVFSRFSEELLAVLDRHPDVDRPVALVDADAFEALQEAWFLGLDEGATPLCGGEPWIRSAEGDGGGGPGGDRRDGRRGARASPVVFTNVEPEMRIARLRRAVPVLVLVRVESHAAGLELARVLDGS